MSDAVRVAAEILRWQAVVRNPRRYAEQQQQKSSAQAVAIYIGTEAAPRVIEGQAVPLLSRDIAQVTDVAG